MKIIARAVQASFTVLDSNDVEVLNYSVDNAVFTCDAALGLKSLSELAHLFKQLDATHNVAELEPEPASLSSTAAARRAARETREAEQDAGNVTRALNNLIDDANRLFEATRREGLFGDNTELSKAREKLNLTLGRARAHAK